MTEPSAEARERAKADAALREKDAEIEAISQTVYKQAEAMNTLKAALAEARREREEWQRAHDDMTERWLEQEAALAAYRGALERVELLHASCHDGCSDREIAQDALSSPAGQAWLEWGRAAREEMEKVALSSGVNCVGGHNDGCDCIGDTIRALLARAPEGVRG